MQKFWRRKNWFKKIKYLVQKK